MCPLCLHLSQRTSIGQAIIENCVCSESPYQCYCEESYKWFLPLRFASALIDHQSELCGGVCVVWVWVWAMSCESSMSIYNGCISTMVWRLGGRRLRLEAGKPAWDVCGGPQTTQDSGFMVPYPYWKPETNRFPDNSFSFFEAIFYMLLYVCDLHLWQDNISSWNTYRLNTTSIYKPT